MPPSFEPVDLRTDAAEFEAAHALVAASVVALPDRRVVTRPGNLAVQHQDLPAAAVGALVGGEELAPLQGREREDLLAEDLLVREAGDAALGRPDDRIARIALDADADADLGVVADRGRILGRGAGGHVGDLDFLDARADVEGPFRGILTQTTAQADAAAVTGLECPRCTRAGSSRRRWSG